MKRIKVLWLRDVKTWAFYANICRFISRLPMCENKIMSTQIRISEFAAATEWADVIVCPIPKWIAIIPDKSKLVCSLNSIRAFDVHPK